MSGREVAAAMEWSPSRVSRLLNGQRGGSEAEVSLFLGVCKAKKAVRERLLKICREINQPGWWQRHGSRLPVQLVTYIDHEDKAAAIHDFQLAIVPGALQTENYARTLIRDCGAAPASEVEDRVEARIARRSIFARPRPPRCTYFIHEQVLRFPVGDAEIMSEQLHYLLQMAVRNYITVRVVPNSAGVHAGIAGSFSLLEFDEIRPVVYLESQTSTLFLEEPVETDSYRRVLAGLADKALDEGQSKEVIACLAIELYGDREDHDDRA